MQILLLVLTVQEQDHGVVLLLVLIVRIQLFVFLLLPALLLPVVHALVLVLVLAVVYRYLVRLEILQVVQIALTVLTAHLMDHAVVLLVDLFVINLLSVFFLLAHLVLLHLVVEVFVPVQLQLIMSVLAVALRAAHELVILWIVCSMS